TGVQTCALPISGTTPTTARWTGCWPSSRSSAWSPRACARASTSRSPWSTARAGCCWATRASRPGRERRAQGPLPPLRRAQPGARCAARRRTRLRPLPPAAVRGAPARTAPRQLRPARQPLGPAAAGGLLGAMVRPVPGDGAALRNRRRAAGAADAAGQARHPGRARPGRALRRPQHPDAGAVPRRPRAGARVGCAAGGGDRALGAGTRDMTRIVILGSGFAALTTIRRLRALGVREPVTVVSPRDELVYLPSLVWLPSGERSGEDLR